MVIRRKSDADRPQQSCSYLEQSRHEQANQQLHEHRQEHDVDHDMMSDCWCCCTACTDLTWYYLPRKGTWWEVSASGGLRLMQETCAESPGSPVKVSWSTKSSTPPAEK